MWLLIVRAITGIKTSLRRISHHWILRRLGSRMHTILARAHHGTRHTLSAHTIRSHWRLLSPHTLLWGTETLLHMKRGHGRVLPMRDVRIRHR